MSLKTTEPRGVTETGFGKLCMSIIWLTAVLAVWENMIPLAGILFGILVGKRIKRLILKQGSPKSQMVGVVGNVIFWWGMLDHTGIMIAVGAIMSIKINTSKTAGEPFWSFR